MKLLNKRIISLLLAMVMLCGMMPMTAFAVENDGSPLDGLNVLCLGDSITAGQGLTTDTRWTNVLASKYGWNLTNNSQGGISMTSYYYTANGQTDVSIAKKAEVLKTMTTKPDVIIVWGGHNDTSYRYSPLGTWDDETTDSFKGALKHIAELAAEYAPDATLFVLTPLWTTEAPSTLKVPENTTDNNWMFVDAIYEGADIYGWIPVNMDLCGINPFTKSGLLLDNIHPNEAGTEKIVEYLSEELASYGANSKKETIIFNASAVSMKPGESTTLKAVLSPRSGNGSPIFTWSSSNSSVATVDANGKITAVAHGNATITATADNDVSATVQVSVAEGEHTYESTVTTPTCTEQGYTTYTCACGDSYVDDYVDATGEHTYENGICTGCGANEPSESMSLRYDDHLDMIGKTVEIIDAGTPTSYQVGYGVEENAVLDTAVVTLESNTLVATGIGTAKVKIDGVLYEVTVEAAPISLLLLIGQSNMEGNEGEAKQSIVCPDGMVYATYGDRYDMVLENATHYAPSALTGEYRTVNTVGGTDGLSDYPVYMLTDEGDGRKGPDSGFAYEWVKQTGEKVWIVNAAHGGTSLDVWLPGTTQYEECQAMFGACQETLRKEIAAGHFTLSHMAYFWCQGCNDYNKTAEWYVKKYLSMHESLNAEMAFDHDSDAATPAKQFELAGIIPVRAGHSWSNGYRVGTHTDSTNKSSYESFVDLQMTGPRVAQYWMCNNPELEDIVLVCNIGEDWVWMPDGTNGVSSYFNTHYPNGTVNYTTQVQQSASWYKPMTPNAVHDSIHYNQIGYNEVGRESVRNALIYLGINPDYEEETSVKFVDWTGYKEVSAIEAATAGSSGTLVVPIVSPVTRSKTVSYTTSAGLSYKYYDLLADSVNMLSQLHAVGTVNSVTVTPRSLDSYTWNFNGTNLVSDPSEGDMDNSLTLLGGSITDGFFNGIRYKISRSICLNHDSEWGIELKISDWSATTGSMIFSDGSAATTGQPYVYFRPADFFVGFGYYDGIQYNNYGVSLKNYDIACNKGTHTYCLVNRIAADGTNAIWLYVDGAEIAPLTEYYVNSTLADANSNGLSGEDFVLSYIGTSDFAIKGCVINGIRVVETGYDPGIHLHTWSEWETESLPSSKGPGIEQRTCAECGKTQNREVEGVWQKYDLVDHMVDLPEVFCAETNLWSLLPHDKEYYHSGVRWDVNGNVHSVTFAVSGGEHIFATSFGKRGTNGTSSSDGIRLTFFGENGVLKTTSPQETYAEFVTNGGYIIVPKGAIAVNIPMYSNSDDNEIYILNRDHCYENGTCAGCGEAQPGPVITQQPEGVEQEIGKKFAITVKAEGEGLTYQWYVKEAGAKTFKTSVNKTASYAYTMQDYMQGRQVYCVITDAYGNQVTTETATITRPPQELRIVEEPQDVCVNVGEKFRISPKMEGDGLTYQWYVKEPGETAFKLSANKTSSYAYTMQKYMVDRQVYCVITDMYGNEVTTDVATISRPPVELELLSQPTDVSAALGVKFSVSLDIQGDGLTYQWYVKESGAKAFKTSSNKTSAYAYSMQSYMNNRQVYCVITDKYGNQVVTEVVTIHLEK